VLGGAAAAARAGASAAASRAVQAEGAQPPLYAGLRPPLPRLQELESTPVKDISCRSAQE
jgi:hypothetical protein